jgi:hypothetical protein
MRRQSPDPLGDGAACAVTASEMSLLLLLLLVKRRTMLARPALRSWRCRWTGAGAGAECGVARGVGSTNSNPCVPSANSCFNVPVHTHTHTYIYIQVYTHTVSDRRASEAWRQRSRQCNSHGKQACALTQTQM